MKELLTKIRDELKGVIPGIRDSDVFLTIDSGLIPEGARFPCIGIKDGKTLISELPAETIEKALAVEIYLYDRAIPGDERVLAYLDRGKSISVRLRENYLADYVAAVSPVSETPIKLMYNKKGLIMMKGFFFDYEKQEL